MKKVLLGLITIFMVLSLSIVLVKAEGETAVELVDGVQIRTDGNNGLRWVANVTNHKDSNEYGFLFAQGDLAEVTVATPNVVKQVAEGVTEEEPVMKATMTKFPKAAATQDISVVAYAKDGENYVYSSVVVRNLSEVAIEAYEKLKLQDEFVKTVYDASETTFNLNGGMFKYEYSFNIKKYNSGAWADEAMIIKSTSGFTTKNYYRILVKYDETLQLYKVVAVADAGTSTPSVEHDYKIQTVGTPANAIELAAAETIKKIINSPNATNYYLKFTAPTTNACNVDIIAGTDLEMFNGNQLHIGGGEVLPNATKNYYDFEGWFNNSEFTGNKLIKQDSNRNLFAKFVPTNYTINYNLGDGKCDANLITSYNYESNEIILPTEKDLTIEDGQFGGWFDNLACEGEPITSIPAKSFGDKELYALWIMNKPTELELSAEDKTIIDKYNPTIFVNPKFTVGNFIINGNEYKASQNLFNTITAAINAAKENDVIYVFSGNYAENVTINKNGIQLLGANTDIDPNTETRQIESSITKLTVSANSITFNGFTLADQLQTTVESVLISAGISNCVLSYSTIAEQSKFSTNSNGLFKCLGTKGNEVNNLTITNFKVEKTAKRPTLFYGYGINNFTVKDSVFLGSSDSDLFTDAIKIISSDYGNYGLSGNVTFTGNTFKDYGQYLLWFAKCNNVTMNVSNNKFINCGQTPASHAALYIAGVSSSHTGSTVTMENNIVDNSYMLLRMHSSAKNFTVEAHNNSILNSTATYHIKNESTSTINASNNYYDVTPTAAKFLGVSVWEPVLTEDPNK